MNITVGKLKKYIDESLTNGKLVETDRVFLHDGWAVVKVQAMTSKGYGLLLAEGIGILSSCEDDEQYKEVDYEEC